MKKSILFAFALIALTQISYAQFSVGAQAGIDINNINITGIPDVLTSPKNTMASTRAGIFGSYALTENSAVKVELNLVKKGFSINQDILNIGLNIPLEASLNTTLNYVEIPVLYKHSIPVNKLNVYVEGGPSLLYGTHGSITPEVNLLFDFQLPSVDLNFDDPTFNRTAAAVNIGAGVEMPLNNRVNVFAQTRYSMGVTNLMEAPVVAIDTKTRSFNLGVGMSYAL